MHDNHHQDMLIVKLSKGKFILHELSIQRLGEIILILDMIIFFVYLGITKAANLFILYFYIKFLFFYLLGG